MGYSEIRSDYAYGPLFDPSTDDDEGFGVISIDGWKTENDDESGTVIANVIITRNGDIVTCWSDNGARMDDTVLDHIENAKQRLLEAYAEYDNGPCTLVHIERGTDSETTLIQQFRAKSVARDAMQKDFKGQSAILKFPEPSATASESEPHTEASNDRILVRMDDSTFLWEIINATDIEAHILNY